MHAISLLFHDGMYFYHLDGEKCIKRGRDFNVKIRYHRPRIALWRVQKWNQRRKLGYGPCWEVMYSIIFVTKQRRGVCRRGAISLDFLCWRFSGGDPQKEQVKHSMENSKVSIP